MRLSGGAARAAVISLSLVSLLLAISASAQRPAGARAAGARVSLAEARATLLGDRAGAPPSGSTLSLAGVDPQDLIAGFATVTFAPDVTAARAAALIAAAGASPTDSIPALNVYEVRLPASGSLAAAIAALTALPGALRAEPAVRSRFAFRPDDPYYQTTQDYLTTLLHAEQAWDIQQGDPHIVVAIVDSGVDVNHPDLAGQIWTNPNPGHAGCGQDLHGCNFVDPARVDPSCPTPSADPVPNPDVSPSFFHGTFVAGIVGAATNNGIGIAGVVPHASLMPVKVGDCAGVSDMALAQGILYAVQSGAAIVQLSVAGSCGPAPSYLTDAIAAAEQAGVVVVAAAGNESRNCVDSPANVAGVIAVGSTGRSGLRRAPKSNWGRQIAVVAPGEAIVSTVPSGPDSLDYATDSGTSYAAPIVAGLADLLLSQNPLLPPDRVLRLLQEGAVPLADNGEPAWAGAGRIDLAASLRLVPAGYFGRARLNGADVPDGTPVEARIGGRLCGRARTQTVRGQATYALLVDADPETQGCGTPGTPVGFTVNGVPAGTAPWKAAAVPLDLPQSLTAGTLPTAAATRATTATPAAGEATPPAAAATFSYRAGWNLVSGPAGTTFAGAQPPLFTLQAGDTTYEALQGIGPAQAGVGYWAYFAADSLVTPPADGPPASTIAAPAGRFVMIGNPSASRTVTVVGADLIYTYDPLTGQYRRTTTLAPGQGAWAVSLAGGTLTLQ